MIGCLSRTAVLPACELPEICPSRVWSRWIFFSSFTLSKHTPSLGVSGSLFMLGLVFCIPGTCVSVWTVKITTLNNSRTRHVRYNFLDRADCWFCKDSSSYFLPIGKPADAELLCWWFYLLGTESGLCVKLVTYISEVSGVNDLLGDK